MDSIKPGTADEDSHDHLNTFSALSRAHTSHHVCPRLADEEHVNNTYYEGSWDHYPYLSYESNNVLNPTPIPNEFQQQQAPIQTSSSDSTVSTLDTMFQQILMNMKNVNHHDASSFSTHQEGVHDSSVLSCILEFDGASKGNPGLSGAGAVLRANDGMILYRLREGVGIATNNVAEYRAVILGLRFALEKGYKHIIVYGDSKLVCCQIEGTWKTNNVNIHNLCQEAKQLKEKYTTFQINHIPREYNYEADGEANGAIYLRDGQVEVES